MRTAGFQVAVPIVACLLCGAASAQVTRRMSIATDGTQGNSNSRDPVISANGRYVAFWSFSTNLVPGDANGFPDVFVHDRQSGTTELVSVATGRAQGDGLSIAPSISADGRYVAFESTATNLVAGDTNGWFDVFVRDRQNGITELVSISTGGAQGNSVSYGPMISADGRYVGFISDASNLVS